MRSASSTFDRKVQWLTFSQFFSRLITSNLKAAKVLWERVNRNHYRSACVYCICSLRFHIDKHFRHSCDWLTNCMCRRVCVRECVSYNLPSSPHRVYISVTITLYLECVWFLSFSIFFYSGHSNRLCICSECRATNCYFFLSLSLCRVPHRHIQRKKRGVQD